jgi:16S rRNA G966 N2-methylase RsmD
MDINNCPNIILYDTLKKYVIDNINFRDKTNSLFDNIHLINLDFLNSENLIKCDQFLEHSYYQNYINNYNEKFLINANKTNNTEKKNFIIENDYINQENKSLEHNIHLNLQCDEKNNELDYIYDNSSNNSSDNNDPWESSINDDKFYINNKVARIFPVLKNFNNFSKIKIDDESFSYITIREIADMTSKIICYHLLQFNLNPQKIKIVDYTSGVGGNVLSFSKYFKNVYAVEICSKRAEFLQNNINIYGFKNIDVINKCAIEFNLNDLIKINPTVVFMDPPWGGSNYKSNENLLLKLGSMEIEELIINITEQFSDYYTKLFEFNPKERTNNYNNKFIILKLPKNYDVEYLYNYLKDNNNIKNYTISSYLYILNKMLIVVCELQYNYSYQLDL